MRKILILFAHPSQGRSEVNVPLFKASRGIEGVTTVDLYAEYPRYHIDIDREQARLQQHDVVIFMFPLYWYSTPAILKEWQDLVLEYGFAYGPEAKALRGKLFACALTAGGNANAYRAEGYNHFTIRELLRPLEQTAGICGMRFLAPFALFGSRMASEQGRISGHIQCWQKLLLALRDEQLDIDAASQAQNLLDELSTLIREPA